MEGGGDPRCVGDTVAVPSPFSPPPPHHRETKLDGLPPRTGGYFGDSMHPPKPGFLPACPHMELFCALRIGLRGLL